VDSQVLDPFAIFFLQNISDKLGNKENKFGAKKNTSSGKKLDSVGLKKQPRNEAQILHQAVAKISYRLFPGMKTISRSETKMVKIKNLYRRGRSSRVV